MIKVQRQNPFTGKVNEMVVNATAEQMTRYLQGGTMIQDAFPSASADEREFIKTGITPEQWDAIMPEEDEDV